LRPHFATEAALALALHRAGHVARAAELAGQVLASGICDPGVVARMRAIGGA
jgi:hypothetical protein